MVATGRRNRSIFNHTRRLTGTAFSQFEVRATSDEITWNFSGREPRYELTSLSCMAAMRATVGRKVREGRERALRHTHRF